MKVLRLATKVGRAVGAQRHLQPALGIEPVHHPQQAFEQGRDRAALARQLGRAGGARTGEVVVHLATGHAHLFAHQPGRHGVFAIGGIGSYNFV